MLFKKIESLKTEERRGEKINGVLWSPSWRMMGKDRRCTHGCSDGFEKMRRSSGVKEAAKTCFRLFPFFPFFKQINFKKMDRSCDERAGVRWAVEGLVTVATLLLFSSLQILSSSFTYSI